MELKSQSTVYNLYCWPLVVALILCGCSMAPSVYQSTKDISNVDGQQRNTAQQSGKSQASNDPNSSDAPEWRKESWRRFIADGRYRVAKAEDFRIPEAAKKDRYQKIDLDNAIENPFVAGDINHDNRSNDLAVIVVDTTLDSERRFGLIIFNTPVDKKSSVEPVWLYHERDLSRVTLSWWSGGLGLREYNNDGTYNLCYVNWNKLAL